jgi:hypothetical protein
MDGRDEVWQNPGENQSDALEAAGTQWSQRNGVFNIPSNGNSRCLSVHCIQVYILHYTNRLKRLNK